MARLPPEERRRQLLDATLELACAGGFDAITTDGVARRAGVTRPMIYDLFGDLDGLLVALIDREEARAMEAVGGAIVDDPAGRPAGELLARGFHDFVSAVVADPWTWQLLLLPPQGSPSALRHRIEDNRTEVVQRLVGLVEWALAPRDLGDLDHEVLAHLLVAAGEDAARLALADPGEYPADRFAAVAGTLFELLPAEGAQRAKHGTPPRVAAENDGPAATALPAVSAAAHPAGTRLPRAQRREQLLDVTLALLVADGFDGLSIEAIARHAGVSRNVVYRSFGSLHLALVALLAREQGRVDRTLDGLVPDDPGDYSAPILLDEALGGFLADVEAHPLTWRLALLPPESAPKALRAYLDRRRAALERRVRRLVAWGIPQLDVATGSLDVELVSRLLLSTAEQLGRLALDGDSMSRERLQSALRALFAVAPWRPERERPDRVEGS